MIVRAVAIAMEDGMLGEKITVRKPNTEIDYQVTVIGRNLVSSNQSVNQE